MRSVIVLAAGLTLAAVGPAAATDVNTLHLEARGCPNCDLYVEGLIGKNANTKSFSQKVPLYKGIGTVTIPTRFASVSIGVQDRAGKTGWNSLTTVALLYRGYQPGDTVTNRQSRKAKWAQDCLPVTQPETWLTFRVVKDANPTKYRKDPTWTRYSLRAWASPQIAGTGNYTEAWHGRTANQQTMCGYGTKP